MKTSHKKLFFIILFSIISISFVYGMFTYGRSVQRALHPLDFDTYMDFYNSMMYKDKPYENKVIYPPLCNVFYYTISSFIPRNEFTTALKIRDTQMGRFLCGIYITLSTLLFVYALIKLKKGNIEEQILLLLTLVLSNPFLFQLERANSIFFTLSFTMLYIHWYNSSNKIKKHIAFICLSIASAIKIYPAIYGFLLLREKRWKDAAICIAYGLSFFFLPIILVGGFSKLPMFIKNIFNTSNNFSNYLPRFKVSISNLFHVIAKYSNIDWLTNLSLPITLLLIASGLFIFLFAQYDSKWKTLAIPTLLIITIPSFSFIYSLIFLTIPLIFFLDDEKQTINLKSYLALFIIILAPLPIKWYGYLDTIALLIMIKILWSEGMPSAILQAKHYLNVNFLNFSD